MVTCGGILYTKASCFIRRVLSGSPPVSGAALPAEVAGGPPLAGIGGGADPPLEKGLAMIQSLKGLKYEVRSWSIK